jgi:hypothetical protein
VNRWISLLLCTTTLAACGPMYRTEYHLTPPGDGRGRACVARCSDDQAACQSRMDAASEDTFRNCELRAEQDYSRCLLLAKDDKAKRECSRSSCERRPDYSGCESAFRNCFEACGGKVDAQQVCTFNCP